MRPLDRASSGKAEGAPHRAPPAMKIVAQLSPDQRRSARRPRSSPTLWTAAHDFNSFVKNPVYFPAVLLRKAETMRT